MTLGLSNSSPSSYLAVCNSLSTNLKADVNPLLRSSFALKTELVFYKSYPSCSRASFHSKTNIKRLQIV